jgi:hypothetical protein
MRRGRTGLAAVLAFAFGACGTGWSTSAPSPTTTPPDIGTSLGVATTTTLPPQPTTTKAPVVYDDDAAKLYQSAVETNGFRLYLVAGNSTRHHLGETIVLNLRVENWTGRDQEYDTNERIQFEIVDGAGKRVWTDLSCRPREYHGPTTTGNLTLAPRESVSYSESYPVKPGHREDGCRLPPGDYRVRGQFPWCPPGSAPNGTCWPDRVTYLQSAFAKLRLLP